MELRCTPPRQWLAAAAVRTGVPNGCDAVICLTDDEFQQLQSRDGLEELKTRAADRPRVLYHILHKATRLFLVAQSRAGSPRVAWTMYRQARVELILPGVPAATRARTASAISSSTIWRRVRCPGVCG